MEPALLDEWKKLSATLNKYVQIVVPGEVMVGRAIDIDTTGALIIEGSNGSVKKALAGDCIHLREEARNASSRRGQSAVLNTQDGADSS